MTTRIYLKEKPADSELLTLLALKQDEFGWYYSANMDLEHLELPLAIVAENVKRVMFWRNISQHDNVTWANYIESCEYRHESSIAVYEYLQYLRISGPTLKEVQDFWRLFRLRLASPFRPEHVTSRIKSATESQPVSPRGNRVLRALRVLVGAA